MADSYHEPAAATGSCRPGLAYRPRPFTDGPWGTEKTAESRPPKSGKVTTMPDVMAIVSKAIFEKAARGKAWGACGRPRPITAPTSSLRSWGQAAGCFWSRCDRPRKKEEALWLVGVLESPSFDGEAWTAGRNRRPIADVTAVKDQLRFEVRQGPFGWQGLAGDVAADAARADRCRC